MDIKHNLSSPNNLPDGLPGFVNRLQEIEQVRRLLTDQTTSVVTISGFGGIGKTTFALKVARNELDTGNFPGGIVWINCNQFTSLSKILKEIAQVVGVDVEKRKTNELRERLGRHLIDFPALLIFDDYETVAEDDAILSFIGHLPKLTKTIILTRRSVKVSGREYSVRLAGFDEKAAMELLKNQLKTDHINENDSETLRAIYDQTGGLPLALSLVVSLIKNGQSPNDILNKFREGTVSEELAGELVFDQVYDTLSDQQRKFLEILCTFVHPIDSKTVASIAEIENDWRFSVDDLARKSVVEVTDGRYTLHPLMRAYLQNRMGQKKLTIAQNRMVEYYLYYINEFKSRFGQIEREWPNVQNAVETAYRNGLWQQFIEMILNLGQFLNTRSYEDVSQKWLKQALEVSNKIGNISTRASLLHNLAVQYQQRGDTKSALALYQQSLEQISLSGDLAAESAALTNIGSIYRSRNEFRSSIEYYERALMISRQIGDRLGEANILGSLGVLYSDIRQYDKAINYYEQALVIGREIGDRRGEANDLGNLGATYASLGDYHRAIVFFEQALVIGREIGDRRREVNVLDDLGATYARLGEYSRAIDNYERAFVITREIGDRRREANIVSNLGTSYDRLGDYSKAIDYYEKALLISREIRDRQGEANVLGNLAATYDRLGEYARAINYYEQALKISEGSGSRRSVASLYGNLGITYSNLYTTTGNISDIYHALDFYNLALKTFEPKTSPQEYATIQNNIANIYANLQVGDRAENVEKAISYYQEALKYRALETDPVEWASTQSNIAIAFSQRVHGEREENLRQAIARYEQALGFYTRENFPSDWLRITSNLIVIYAELGEWSEAKKYANSLLDNFQSAVLEANLLKAFLPWYQRIGELALQSEDLEFATRVFAQAANRFELEGEKVPYEIQKRLIELRDKLGDDRFVIITAEAQGVLTPVLAQTLHEARELMNQERFGEAVNKFSHALTLISEIDAKEKLKQQNATVLFLRGFCFRKQGLWEDALRDQENSFQLFEELKEFVGEAHTSLEIGQLFEVMNNYEDARLHYMDAYRLYRRVEDKRGMALASENLGRLEYRVRMFPQAVQDLEEAKTLYILTGERVKAEEIDSELEAARASLLHQIENNHKRDENR